MTLKTLKASIIFLAVALSASAQLVVNFAGQRNAIDYAYGLPGVAFPALQVASGNTSTTGTNTITLVTGASTQSNGNVLFPVTTNTPITVGIGSNAETVTPSAVSNCNLPSSQTAGPLGPNCTISATFANLHGPQEPVTSGTYGLQEAINSANTANGGGGTVMIDSRWQALGGTTAIITAATAFNNVGIYDTRDLRNQWWTMQPTTLTVIPNTVALTTTTAVFSATPVGTWANSAYYLCYTYVDAMGGESTCSPTANQTPTLNYSLTVTSPAATTGAVGWRMYAGATYTLAYLLPVNSTTCTVTTLETVVPACALGSSGTWTAAPLTTTLLRPGAIGVTNTKNPVPQSHTTFGYQPSQTPPLPFVTHFGPFGSGTISSATASDITPLGSFELPAGFLNYIGRTIRITGKIQGGETSSGTLGIFLGTVWAGGVTAGLPITVCNPTSAAAAGTVNYTWSFSCTLTTNAVGATAVGTIQPDSWFLGGGASGTTVMLGTEASLTAVGSLGLFAQQHFDVYITPGTEAITAAQLMDLNIEVLQ